MPRDKTISSNTPPSERATTVPDRDADHAHPRSQPTENQRRRDNRVNDVDDDHDPHRRAGIAGSANHSTADQHGAVEHQPDRIDTNVGDHHAARGSGLGQEISQQRCPQEKQAAHYYAEDQRQHKRLVRCTLSSFDIVARSETTRHQRRRPGADQREPERHEPAQITAGADGGDGFLADLASEKRIYQTDAKIDELLTQHRQGQEEYLAVERNRPAGIQAGFRQRNPRPDVAVGWDCCPGFLPYSDRSSGNRKPDSK